jgi:hypothetical protein
VDELLKMLQDKANLSGDQAQKAIETVMGFLKDKLPGPIGDQVGKLLGGGDGEGAGGALGGIGDKLGGMFGKKD